MENLLIYFLKVNGLIVLFYLMYVLFLRKETFFTSNRWYFLTGLLLSLVLPLITFTKTIWVEPTPIPEYYEEAIPITYNTIETPTQAPLDWSLILMSAYFVISILIIVKIGMELVSFFRRIQKQNKQKESDYTLVDSNAAENPFSFFSYIVINKEMFTEEELQHILTHESIHVKQKHSFDVLLGKVFCALFWANPIIWLYRKAMLQNLEFIADNETFQQIENKYLYQRTLLKVVTHQHNLSITNQFYQSLIKKRIVMLHTNQSHKKNVWKYATILPLLVGFLLLFQIETVAQVKEVTSENQQNEKVIFEKTILKTASDEEIKKIISELDAFLSINTSIKRIDRTKSKELKTLIFEYIDKKGHEGEFGISGINEDFPDESFLYAEKSNDTILKIGLFNSKWLEFAKKENNSIDEKLSKQFGTEIKVKMAKVIDDADSPTPPTPPTPPNHPFESLMDAPTPPDFPSVPDFPSNIDDKKAMEKYEKAMATFEKKMKAIEPKMKEFEKKMEVFEKEMKLKEPDMKKFEEEMKIFEQKMKVFEKEMEVYEKEIEKSSAEYYINGEKVSKEEVEKMQTDEIESINIRKNSSPNRIEIKKTEIKKTK